MSAAESRVAAASCTAPSRISTCCPAALFVARFLLYPMVITLWRASPASTASPPRSSSGSTTIVELFIDPHFLVSLRNTLIWTVAAVILPVGLGLRLALGLNHVRGAGFFKASIYLPATISAAAIGILLHLRLRLQQRRAERLPPRRSASMSYASRWLFEAPLNTFSMIAAYTWQQTGLNLMLFLVGLQGLSDRADRGGEARRLHRPRR